MPPSSHTPPRREFLSQLAATVALATVACAPAIPATPAPTPAPGGGTAAGAGAAAAPPPAPVHWDDTWTTRVMAAKHKAVFDAPELADGEVAIQAYLYLQGMQQALGAAAAETAAVLVIRHRGIPFALNDLLWDRYELGKRFKLKDPTTGKAARRNPLLHAAEGDEYALVSAKATLPALQAQGATLLACNRAAMGMAYEITEWTKRPFEEAKAEVRGNLVDGVILQPSGVYATLRAQEVGCAFMRSA